MLAKNNSSYHRVRGWLAHSISLPNSVRWTTLTHVPATCACARRSAVALRAGPGARCERVHSVERSRVPQEMHTVDMYQNSPKKLGFELKKERHSNTRTCLVLAESHALVQVTPRICKQQPPKPIVLRKFGSYRQSSPRIADFTALCTQARNSTKIKRDPAFLFDVATISANR